MSFPHESSGCEISCFRICPAAVPSLSKLPATRTTMITGRSWCLLALLALLASSFLITCGESPTEDSGDLLGNATITVEKPTGNWAFTDGEAAFFVYNNGPTPNDRAMYLVLSAGNKTQGPIEIERFQFLEANASGPKAGTYRARYGALGGDPTMGGSALFLGDITLTQVYPVEESSTVTLLEVTPDRLSGNLSMVLKKNSSSALPDVRISGTFKAVRVEIRRTSTSSVPFPAVNGRIQKGMTVKCGEPT